MAGLGDEHLSKADLAMYREALEGVQGALRGLREAQAVLQFTLRHLARAYRLHEDDVVDPADGAVARGGGVAPLFTKDNKP